MNKVFLYLYPIKDYTKMFLHDDEYYDEEHLERPLPILNETIEKRYREKGYQVVFVLYSDRDLYGIEKKEVDKVIFTDIFFSDSSNRYPSEELLLNQLGNIDELVVGGYHVLDCVKRVAENALLKGINTLVDLDLTDLFFKLYQQKEYFDIYNYDPDKLRSFMVYRRGEERKSFEERIVDRNYSSPVYSFIKK